jgi:uroporphyrinogen decarboxylase
MREVQAMTGRERVLAAIGHERTDRAPANYGAHQEVSDALAAKLGVPDQEGLLQALGVDIRHIPAEYYLPEAPADGEGWLTNMWGVRRRLVGRDPDRYETVYPFDEDTTIDEVHAHPWPDPAKLDYSGVKAACAAVHDTYATVGAPWSPFYHEVWWIVGQESFFIWMSTKPEVLSAIIRHVVGYEIEATRRFLEAADGLIDITYVGNDYGSQRGLAVSPAMWNAFIRAEQKRYFDLSHDFGCRVMFHSCGSVRDLVGTLIEDGVDVLDPVQVQAAGMDLGGLCRDFGGRLCFHGGVDTQGTLPFVSSHEVREHVRGHLDLFRDSGGYILTGSQLYIGDIPLDNILAIYEENLQGPVSPPRGRARTP